MRTYEYRHRVGLEETNLIGNVYYVNHLRWQGRCREMFLHERAPEVLDQLRQGLLLVTTRCSCDYYGSLDAFDEIAVRMSLVELGQSRLTMRFDYFRIAADGTEERVARGEQKICCMGKEGGSVVPVPVPAVLREALRPYQVQ